ncbi:MAG TPA: TolC family outer membrane protein, partial [Gammaproteobacteria bacterium]|nr:TolC family outer membrane protein [Gammaproteobacteria bacterium]
IVRVAEAYFNLLSAKDTLNAARANLAALEQQLEQTKKRYEVGLIAITDVQESQAAYDLAAAEEIQAELEVVTQREVLSVIIGQYVENLAAPEDIPLVKPEPSNPDAWVELAMEQNLNLIAARFALKNAYANVDIAQAGHYPTLGFNANYNDNTNDLDVVVNGVPYPETTSTSTSLSLQLTVPIFSGGSTSSQVDEAAALAMAQHAQLKLTTRETKQLARTAYLGVVSNLSRVKALKQAVKSAETALEATEAGYEVGTRTTVDVLTSRQNLFTARTNYARAKYDYIINLLKLKAAAGTLTVESIKTINTWLK